MVNLVILQTLDGYDASRILLPALHERLKRLLGTPFAAGIPNRDFAIWPQDFDTTLQVQGTKLFMIKPDDTQDVTTLQQMYPQGVLSTFHSSTNIESKNFMILFVPSNE